MYNLASEGLYMDQAYATAVILLVLVVLINTLSGVVAKKLTSHNWREKYEQNQYKKYEFILWRFSCTEGCQSGD